ncbi:cytochrome P450 6k1-like [Papilio machaon]|uniref:cytochrome P450 6k1-like n=1 Tax=Papilio machaon TaxID=76193 RepID=UPI001E665B44|nr:cytochrome P450 6k1-like [Papilio machaon]
MGWLDRVANQDYQIDEHLTVPAGTPVYVNAVGIQSDPNIFPEPDKFWPERFLENDINRSSMPVWTFGEGPRSCIGRRFALINLRCALAYMVVTFKFRPMATTPSPARVQVERYSLFYTPGEPLLINFEHRK